MECRPSINDVGRHPYFWTAKQKLLFLKDASDRLEIEKSSAPMVIALESSAVSIVGEDWKQVKMS